MSGDRKPADPELVELEAIAHERHERSMRSRPASAPPLPPANLTYRQLLRWLESWAKEHEDGALDMPVVLRLSNEESDDWMVGGLYAIDVDAGCTETDALVLDGSSTVDDLISGHGAT